jgi:cell fate regulator YaaT (PSP1 superfamily)
MPTMEQTGQPFKLVAVRFENLPATAVYDAGVLDLAHGDRVLVNTDAGQCVARVVGFPDPADVPSLEEVKPVVRPLSDEDLERLERIRAREMECFEFCQQRIRARGLPMKLIRVEQFFDENKITFYFSSEGRVDFRELLRDLVDRYRTRIELRQVGTRQESAMLGGIASCGRELCCATFLTNFQRISVKMAKYQNMTLNPTKISGLCGKLKCCLAYEKESYANLIENLPKPGKKVFLADGEAVVVSINVINQTFVAKLSDRRFVKAHVADVLTEEEYRDHLERKTQHPEREAPAGPEVAGAEDEAPMVPMIAQQQRPKKRRPRNRGPRKKRSRDQ